MGPSDVTTELRSQANFTEEESKAFRELRNSSAYKKAVHAMSRMHLVCGDMALNVDHKEPQRVDYYRGVRDGTGLFFDLCEQEAGHADHLIAEAIYREETAQGVLDEAFGEIDRSEAVSQLGESNDIGL